MENESLISVIVPVYKVEKYLNECVDSIVNQTYKNLEIILVDDGSPDNCPKMCDDYAKKDSRIKVIHKENGGLANARNFGMKEVTGNYILYVDSDDYIATDAIQNLYNEIIENDSDISIGGTYDFNDTNGKRMNIDYKTIKKTFEGDDVLKEFFLERYFTCVVWGRLYKTNVIGDERFDDNLRRNEDFEFTYRVLKRAKKISVNTYFISSYYRIRGDSIIHQTYDKKFEKELELSKYVLEDVKKNYPHLEDYAISQLQRCTLRLINKYFKSNNETKGVKYLFNEIDNYPMKLEFKYKIKLYLLKYFNWPLHLLYKALGRI